ncbi:MAG: class I SAM-dependent methyltransferase [Patescibacteria group bacterium]
MQYFNPHEIKIENKEEIKKQLQNHIGKNLRNFFALNLTSNHILQSNWDKNCNILDIGPASGNFAQQLNKKGYKNVYGIDIDNYLSLQNKPLLKEFKTADLSFDKIPWPDNSFKVVTAWCVLPHLENPFHCVRETHRVLEPNGLFIFSVPNILSKASISYFTNMRDFGSYKESNNHLVIFTQNIIKKAILKYFEVIAIEYHIRDKVFSNNLKGKLRKLIYDIAGKISIKIKKELEKRWAYNAIYILRKKSEM